MRLTLPVILSATFMASFDYMVVNVAAPSLQRDLHAGAAALELVIGGYAFTYAAGLVTGGRLGDLFGHRRMFALGMAAFTLASLLCGLSPDAGTLVAARLLQGVTAAAMVPQVLALITASFAADERARAMSWFGVVTGLGAVCGQVLGGVLLQADLLGLGWRTIFLVNVPVGVPAALLATRVLPTPSAQPAPQPNAPGRPKPDPSEPSQAAPARAAARLDVTGVVGVSGGVALALVPLVLGREEGWPAWAWVSLAASVPVLAATLLWERRTAQPVVDLTLFRARSFSVGSALNIAFMMSFGSLMLVNTLLLQYGFGLSPVRAGLAFGPLALATMAASLGGRRLVARYGRRALTAGCAITALGVAGIEVVLHAGGGVAELLAPLALLGLGSGLTLPGVIGAALSGVRPDQAGAASGLLSTFQQFSGAAGVAALGALFFSLAGRHGLVGAAQYTLLANLALTLATIPLTLLLPRPDAPRKTAKSRSGTSVLDRRI
ncbi:MFS transporter [Actinomadura rupiterrae]|uniref:MFS transporter n=1 Tax=Actinomadura rupiterrae TaxID=559627 RepID=UPI0020A56D9D|nr:MFS transporter [Actinomadura rupiterrae]MCP2337244.1 MFS family permease [Actinomadura rupiterrae]